MLTLQKRIRQEIDRIIKVLAGIYEFNIMRKHACAVLKCYVSNGHL